MKKLATFLGIVLSWYSIFGEKNEAILKQKILFAYQFYTVARGRIYLANKNAITKYSLKPCKLPPEDTQPLFLHHMFLLDLDKWNYAILNAYVLKYNLGPHTPFPADVLQVEGIPLAETFIDFYTLYIQNIHLHGDWYYKDHKCVLSEENWTVIERVLQNDSKDKRILFLGFDVSCPTEGGNIFFDTPHYRHSLFWSNADTKTRPECNRIKACFCQSQELLGLGLKNYFDYIIIGGQTVEYINLETWASLRYFLKEGGCIVYPEMLWHYWGGEITNHLLNSLGDDSCEFELRRCDDPKDPIFSEIRRLTRFNNTPSYGDFCYGDHNKHYAVYLHKKREPRHKKLDCLQANL